MNIFKLFLFLLISPLVFTSCETSQTPVDELSSLLEKIDNNSENYSEEDWNNITNEFTEIEEELSKYEYTDEELKEIGRIKGQILAKMAKSAVKDLKKQMEYLQLIIPQYFISNKSGIWSLSLIVHSKG